MYLLADIGATNTRLQAANEAGLQGDPLVVSTPAIAQVTDLVAPIEALRAAQPIPATWTQVVFAVAGPVNEAGEAVITNTGLALSNGELTQLLGAPAQLINDFEALAYGLPAFSRLRQVGGAARIPGRNQCILGPGTGLGVATLVYGRDLSQPPVVVPSEGGHVDLSPGSHLELELWGALAAEHGQVCWETVLCGQGLVNLYKAMCQVWGSQPEALQPADVTERGLSMADPVCHQTLETFAGLLGSAAANFALTSLAHGGVYLAGGITPILADFLETSPLRRRFEEKGKMTHLVQQIPLFIVEDDYPGLLGAWQFASLNNPG